MWPSISSKGSCLPFRASCGSFWPGWNLHPCRSDSWLLPAGKFPHDGLPRMFLPPVWFPIWNSSLHTGHCQPPWALSASWMPCALSFFPFIIALLSRSFWAPPPLSSGQTPPYSSVRMHCSLMKLPTALSNTQGLVSPHSHRPFVGLRCCNSPPA